MDPSGSAVGMEAMALVAVFAIVVFTLSRLSARRGPSNRKRDRNGDGAVTSSDDDGHGDGGGDGGGD